MRLSKGLTPYPILRNDTDDFIHSRFYADVIPSIELDKIHFQIKIHVEQNKEILNDLKKGLLQYAVQIESPKTSFRQSYIQSDNVFRIDISDSDLSDTIEIRTFIIVASKTQYAYSNKDFHKDYKGIQFSLDKGNIIADWGMIIELNKNNVDNSKLNSVIKVRFSKMNNNMLDVDMENDYLTIKIDEKYKSFYCDLGQEIYKQTILSLIMVPAMEFVLIRLKECGEDMYNTYGENRWFSVINNSLQKNGIDIERLNLNNDDRYSVLNVAQMIFANPIKRAFEELNESMNERKE